MLADKAQSTSTTIALLLCTELHPDSLCAHSSATILGGRGLFLDLIGHIFLGSPSEFGIQRKHLLRTWVNKGKMKGRGMEALALN